MPDYRVTFKGDLGNLAQFDAAIKNSMNANARAVEASMKSILGQAGLQAKLFTPGTTGAGLFTRNLKTEIDGVNRTFRQSGDIFRKVISDYEVSVTKAGKHVIKPIFDEQYQSSFKKTIGDLDAYEEALARVGIVEQRILGERKTALQQTLPLQRRIEALTPQKLAAQQAVVAARTTSPQAIDLTLAQSKLDQLLAAQQAGGKGLGKQIKAAQGEVTSMQAALSNLVTRAEADLAKIEARLATTQARIDSITGAQQTRANRIRGANPAYADLQTAIDATPPVPRELANVLATSKDLQKKLLSIGLGGGAQLGTEQFKKAVAQQEATISNYVENVRTGTRLVSGSFRDNIGGKATGILKTFSIELDKNGNFVGRWGQNLAGLRSTLEQTVRNLQKVVQWTVATSIVFGTLATVVGQLKNINELNTLLARLSITAQTTAQDTQKLFKDLGQVAIETATPLTEIIKVADDIALATREAGQSTDEWRGKIVDLTRAVGIFTNLTGVDTVEATDQLSAAFKQLNVAPSELVGILSKVTAVAGGQSNAIADIVKSLSGLAEAAKAAGFSVDEQIASIQVLSQVTNKSSDEIATAFKNLFGSVSSVGSEKILKEFGIEIRDASGGIRDFLDIYRDVKKALDSGIIPQNRLPDILRGIAGGPRRAPDAAALLANLGRIDEVIGKSVGASNEALIANAKILDTNQAKITQFQNAINIAIFEKFGKAVSDLVDQLVTLGNVITTVFNSIDANTVSVLVRLGAFVLAAKTVGAALKLLGFQGLSGVIAGLKGLAAGFAQAGVSAEVAAGQVTLFGAASGRGGLSSVLSKIKGNKGIIAGLGIAAAGVVGGNLAKGSGIDTNTISTALQLGGGLVALIPGLQAVGIGALAAGTALQVMAGDSAEVTKSAQQTAQEVYTLAQSLKEFQDEANGYVKTQKDANNIITQLKDKTHKTADEQARLAGATSTFVTATLALADANAKVDASFKSLIETLPGVAEKYEALKDIGKNGLISADDLKKLQVVLAQEILRGSGQAVFASKEFNTQISPTYRVPQRTNEDSIVKDIHQQTLDLKNLLENPTELNRLFSSFGGTTKEIFDALQDPTNLQYVQAALAKLPDLVATGQGNGIDDQRLQQLLEAVNKFAQAASQFSANTLALTQQQALIQAKIATGSFTGAQGANATRANTIAQNVNTLAGNYREPLGPQVPGQVSALQQSQALIAEFAKAADQGLELTNEQLIRAGKLTLVLNGTFNTLANTSEEALNQGIYEAMKNAGLSTEQLDLLAKSLNQTLTQTADIAEEVTAAFDKARSNAASTFADRSLQLLISKNSGDFEKNAKGLKILQDVNKQAFDSTNALIDSIEHLSQDAMVELNNSLSNTIGLQGAFISQNEATSLTTQDVVDRVTALSQKLIDNAVAAGVNAQGITKLQTEVAKLIELINLIPTYKQVILDVTTRLQTIQPGQTYSRGAIASIQQDQAALKAAQDALKAAQSAGSSITDTINKILQSGTGSKIGQLPKTGTTRTAKGPDVSEIDLPDEIANAVNRSALIQEAIRRARALQKTIPGATKEGSDDIVALLKGTQNILNVRGIKDDYLRRALEELADIEKKRLEFETKADTIRRIRFQAGDISALANVPVNTRTGISLGSPQGPINISLNLNGTILTPAQLSQFADLIAASLKRQIAG